MNDMPASDDVENAYDETERQMPWDESSEIEPNALVPSTDETANPTMQPTTDAPDDGRTTLLKEASRRVGHKPTLGREDSFAGVASSWANYLHGRDTDALGEPDVAAMMVLLKIERIKANPNHRDSWVDIAGYAACGGEKAVEL